MICFNHPYPRNCNECMQNFDGICIASGIINSNNAFEYRTIDSEFGEGTNSRPEWCPAMDSTVLVEKIKSLIDESDFKKIGRNSKSKINDKNMTKRSQNIKNNVSNKKITSKNSNI